MVQNNTYLLKSLKKLKIKSTPVESIKNFIIIRCGIIKSIIFKYSEINRYSIPSLNDVKLKKLIKPLM